MFDKDPLISQEEAAQVWEWAKDPDAFPDINEDRISKEYDYASEAVFIAYVEGKLVPAPEPPYLEVIKTETVATWNPNFEQLAPCLCGHTYERHFDGYDDNSGVGCKYCMCLKWATPA
jgi:hypothetical protein